MIGDIYNLALSGIYCGVPFANVMCYKQIEEIQVGTSLGRELVEQWFGGEGGPWQQIRASISEQLTYDCAVVTYGSTSDTVLLSDGQGLAVEAALPTMMALQVNTPSNDPHYPGHNEGRFYQSGFLIGDDAGGVVQTDIHTKLHGWMNALLTLGGTDWVMYPHFKYRDRNGGTTAQCALPYWNTLWKIIGNRKADDCATFAATGAPEFGGYPIPQPTP